MPPLDTVSNRPAKLRPPKTKKRKVVYGPPAPKPKPTVLKHPTPDQADRNRAPAQKRRDKEISERNIRVATRKVVAKRTAPKRQLDTEGTRARGPSPHPAPAKPDAGVLDYVKHALGGGLKVVTGGASGPSTRPRTKKLGAGTGFAAIDAQRSTRKVPGIAFGLGSSALADAGELTVTAPSTIYRTAEVAVTEPKKLPGMLIEPYKELVEHPVKMLTERPVTTALMVAPVVRVPVRGAARVRAFTGKRSLAAEPATMEGTSIKAQRKSSKGEQEIDDAEINRRVDEAFDAAQLHRHRAIGEAIEAGKTPKQASKQARAETKRRFAEEFGSPWYAVEHGVVRPKHPRENSGVLHPTREAANRVAAKVPFDASVIKLKSGKKNEQFAVVPKAAYERWRQHQKVGNSKATPAVAMRLTNRMLKTAVLPTSTRWMGGQVVEAGLRSLVMGAGPTSLIRGKRLLKALPDDVRHEVELRTTGGGQFGATGPTAEFASKARTFEQEFSAAGPKVQRVAKGATKVGAAPGLRHLRGGYRKYVEGVFAINDKVESLAKTAMLGKAVKQGPLMERSVAGLTKKAIDDAAKGLHETSAQVELGRALDRAYGRYSKFGWEARNNIAYWTPFVPWFLNMTRFLLDVLPRDHPVVTALVADLSAATEEWRVEHGLSLHGEHVPGFMLGSAPTKDGRYIGLSHFGPFMPAEPISAAVGNLLPVLRGPILAGAGVDWAGRPLGEGEAVKGGSAALGVAESLIPGVSQVSRVTGLGERVRGRPEKADETREKGIPQAIIDMLNPLKPIGDAGDEGEDYGIEVPDFSDDIEVSDEDIEPSTSASGSAERYVSRETREHPAPGPIIRERTVTRRTPKGKRVTKRTVKQTPSRRVVKGRTLYSWPSDPPGKPARHTIPWREHDAHLVAWHRNRSRSAR